MASKRGARRDGLADGVRHLSWKRAPAGETPGLQGSGCYRAVLPQDPPLQCIRVKIPEALTVEGDKLSLTLTQKCQEPGLPPSDSGEEQR